MTTIAPATPNVTTAAIRGLARAEKQAAEAAGKIAAAGTQPAPQDMPAPATQPEAPPPPPPIEQPASGLPVQGDLARPMVDMMVAQRAYQANAMVLRSDQEMRSALPRALRV